MKTKPTKDVMSVFKYAVALLLLIFSAPFLLVGVAGLLIAAQIVDGVPIPKWPKDKAAIAERHG